MKQLKKLLQIYLDRRLKNHNLLFWKGKHKQNRLLKAFLTLINHFFYSKLSKFIFFIQYCLLGQQESSTIVFEIFFEVVSFEAGILLISQEHVKGRLLDNVQDLYAFKWSLKFFLTKRSGNCHCPALLRGIIKMFMRGPVMKIILQLCPGPTIRSH